MIVVLPAPLGPISPATVPVGTLNETWSTAVREPNRFVRPSTVTASVDGIGRTDAGAPGAVNRPVRGWL